MQRFKVLYLERDACSEGFLGLISDIIHYLFSSKQHKTYFPNIFGRLLKSVIIFQGWKYIVSKISPSVTY